MCSKAMLDEFAFDRECTAIHEAAHAVAFIYHGIQVNEMSMTFNGQDAFTKVTDTTANQGRLISLLAGIEAEKVLLHDNAKKLQERQSGWKKDIEGVAPNGDEGARAALRELGRNDDDEEIEKVGAQAAAFVRDALNWKRIVAIADKLQALFDDSCECDKTLLDVKKIYDSVA